MLICGCFCKNIWSGKTCPCGRALRAKKLFGGKDFEALADKGYYKAEDLKKCVESGITSYVTKQIYSNGTGDKDFYTDKFKYDKDKKVYICPAGKELHYARDRKKNGEIIGHEYRNLVIILFCQKLGGVFIVFCQKIQIG